MKHAVRLAEGTTDQIEGIGLPYGGPWVGADGQGRDLYGQFFSAKTEFCLDWFSERPLLYQHGFDEGTRVSPVGRVKAWEIRSDGVWVQAQLDASSDYFEAIKDLIEKGRLYFSSGSVEHLFKAAKNGEILMWPWIELSLTPTPANLFATLDQPTAEKHFEIAGLSVKSLTDRVKALPAEPVPAGGRNGYDPPDGSYEALIQKLSRAVNGLLCPAYTYDDDLWCYVIATFPSYVVACRYGNGVQYFEVEYSIGDDGGVTLGDSREVQLAYIPVDPIPADEAPLAILSAHTIQSATALLERTKDLRERRANERRVLSDAHRARVKQAHARLADLLNGLAVIVADPDPDPAAVAEARTLIAVQAAHIRVLAASCGVEVSS